MTRWYEDIVCDEPHVLGSHSFTEHEIVRFARQYDPEFFHTDREAAAHSVFGGLVASNLHAVSVGQRKMVDALFAEEKRLRSLGQEPGLSGPSPGVNRMRFQTQVRPGDSVSYTLTVTGKRASKSLPGWGLLFNTIQAVNQRGELVYEAELVGFSKRRDYRMPLNLRVFQSLMRLPVLRTVLRPK